MAPEISVPDALSASKSYSRVSTKARLVIVSFVEFCSAWLSLLAVAMERTHPG